MVRMEIMFWMFGIRSIFPSTEFYERQYLRYESIIWIFVSKNHQAIPLYKFFHCRIEI